MGMRCILTCRIIVVRSVMVLDGTTQSVHGKELLALHTSTTTTNSANALNGWTAFKIGENKCKI